MKIDQMTVDAVQASLAAAELVLVVTHVDPDGDALGSLTAVGQALNQLGKRVHLAVDAGMLPRFGYLALADEVRDSAESDTKYDLLIAVDCGDEQRLGNVYAELAQRPPVINIDHHITNTQFGIVNLVDPSASSTTEILLDLFEALGITLTQPLAVSLLTGLVTDTQSFRTSNVTARTLAAASRLVAAGADLHEVTLNALRLQSYAAVKLWRTGLLNTHMAEGVIWTTISYAEQQAADFSERSSGGLVSFLSDVEEALISTVLMERDDGRISVSMRSREPYNVARVAVALGGGGHPVAAGCTLDMPLAAAEALVVERCQAALREQRRGAVSAE